MGMVWLEDADDFSSVLQSELSRLREHGADNDVVQAMLMGHGLEFTADEKALTVSWSDTICGMLRDGNIPHQKNIFTKVAP